MPRDDEGHKPAQDADEVLVSSGTARRVWRAVCGLRPGARGRGGGRARRRTRERAHLILECSDWS